MTVVVLHNPLPSALRHYEAALVASLERTGHQVVQQRTPAAEGSVPRLQRLALWLWHLVRLDDGPGVEPVILWPVLGYLDVLLLTVLRKRVSVVVHDPRPLRPQVGLGRTSRALVRLAAGRGVTILAHSGAAAQVMEQDGLAVQTVPHPVAERSRPSSSVRTSRSALRVLGQYKTMRDMQLLQRLGVMAAEAGLPAEVHGRGWPTLPGWDVHPQWYAEQEFQSLVASSRVIVLPYQKYFQSGILIQALENEVPVLAEGQWAEAVLGLDYPGLVKDDDWSAALVRALAAPPEVFHASSTAAIAKADAGWSEWLQGRRQP